MFLVASGGLIWSLNLKGFNREEGEFSERDLIALDEQIKLFYVKQKLSVNVDQMSPESDRGRVRNLGNVHSLIESAIVSLRNRLSDCFLIF